MSAPRRGGKQDSFIISIVCNIEGVLARLLLLGESNGNRENLKGFVKNLRKRNIMEEINK